MQNHFASIQTQRAWSHAGIQLPHQHLIFSYFHSQLGWRKRLESMWIISMFATCRASWMLYGGKVISTVALSMWPSSRNLWLNTGQASSLCQWVQRTIVRTLAQCIYINMMCSWIQETDANRKTAGRCCISYRLTSPQAHEIHTISLKEVHNCTLLPPFDVHFPQYSTYCRHHHHRHRRSGQSYNIFHVRRQSDISNVVVF